MSARRRSTAAAAALCATTLAATATACSSAPAPRASVPTSVSGVAESPTIGYRVGAAATLRTRTGASVTVRLDRARSAVGSDRPTPKGMRLFAVRFRVTDPGTSAVTVSWGSDLLDDTHRNGGPTRSVAHVGRLDAGPLLPDPLTVAPGRTATGWVGYYVATNRTVVSVDFLTGDSSSGIAGWAMTTSR